jgi:hypothetical protein
MNSISATQADAIEIETRAQCRLANEYDAAQERGEVAKQSPAGSTHRRRVVQMNPVLSANFVFFRVCLYNASC